MDEVMRVLGKPIEREYTLHELLRRPGVGYADLVTLQSGENAESAGVADHLVVEQIEIQAKYQGYIDRQLEEVVRTRSHEDARLPPDIDYSRISGLSNEIRQKLMRHRPETVGQAARIQGMTPAAVSILLVHLRRSALEAARGEG